MDVVGCLGASTRVRLASSSADESILGQLAMRATQRVPVWTVDRRGRPAVGLMSRAFFTGVRPTFALGFASGAVIEATANHPFLTVDGWLRVDQLTLGDRVASMSPAPAGPELGWDVLTMIEPNGRQPVYDLTIDGTHNFVANGVVVHNSSGPASPDRDALGPGSRSIT